MRRIGCERMFARTLFSAVFFSSIAWLLDAAPPARGSPWQALDQIPATVSPAQAWVRPQKFHAFHLDHATLRPILSQAPMERTKAAATNECELSLPMPDGSLARFRL